LVLVLLSCGGGGARAGSGANSEAQPVPAPTATEATVTGSGVAPAGATVPVGQAFELPVGGAATVADTQTTVTFLGVQEDSRCPAQVACIWAGRVSAEFSVQAPGQAPETFVLATCCPAPDASHHAYAGQAIDLVGVSPAPLPAGQTISEQDYRAALVVSVT